MVILGIFLTIPVGSMDAAIAAFLGPCVDQIALGRDLHFSARLPFLIVLFTVIQGGFIFFSAYVNGWVGNRVTYDTKKQLFHRLLAMDTDYFDHSDSGTVLLLFSTDAATAFSGLMNHMRFFLTRFFSSISLAVVLLYTSWWLALVALGTVAVAFYPLRLVRKKVHDLSRKSQFDGAKEASFYNEHHAGNRTVAAYNLQGRQKKCHSSLADEMFRTSMRLVRHSNWPSPAMHAIVAVGLAGVLMLGGVLVSRGVMGGGNFATFIAALLLLYTPIKGLGGNFSAIQGAIVAAERVRKTLQLQPRFQDVSPAPEKTLTIREGIRFESVTFAYRGQAAVLNGVDFFVPVGKSIGIVGHSGSGKSTLAHLLLRLYDVTGGRITIDGRDLREISIGDLRRSIAIVFQDNFLFSGTIRDNILLGNGGATDGELRCAVRAALLEEFIDSLPKGLDTEVGERGTLLSGGQKQRIAIARAILKNAPIVVLDEATSALDNRSESLVQRALENLTDNKTVFTIAHRLSTIARVSGVVVLENGKIIEAGTPGELLRRPSGAYAKLQAHSDGTGDADPTAPNF
jgi:subfamily B ATP-binding cassette protein MsbA